MSVIELAPVVPALAVVALAIVIELRRRHHTRADEIPTLFLYGFAALLITFGFAAWSPTARDTVGSSARLVGQLTSIILGLIAVASLSIRWPRGRILSITAAMAAVTGVATWLAGDGMPFDTVLPYVIPAAVLTATPFSNAEVAFNVARRAGLLIVVASVVALLVGREWRVSTFLYTRRGWAPFAGERVAGVLGGPNDLAPIAGFVFVTSVVLLPPGWRRFGSIALSGWVIWATEARVQMLAAPVAILVIWLWRERSRQHLRAVALCFIAFAATTALLPRTSGWSFLPRDHLTTLSGRTDVWRASIDVWLDSPVVGGGVRVFNEAFRLETGLGYAGQAHNQLFQHLANAGALGLLLLAAYLATLWRCQAGLRDLHRDAALGVSVVFGAYLLTAGPLTPSRWSPPLFFTTLLLAVALASGDGFGSRRRGPGGVADATRLPGREEHLVADAVAAHTVVAPDRRHLEDSRR